MCKTVISLSLARLGAQCTCRNLLLWRSICCIGRYSPKPEKLHRLGSCPWLARKVPFIHKFLSFRGWTHLHGFCLSSPCITLVHWCWPSAAQLHLPCHDLAHLLFAVNHYFFPIFYVNICRVCILLLCACFYLNKSKIICPAFPQNVRQWALSFPHSSCLFHLFIYLSAFALLVSSNFRALHRSFSHGA